MLKVINVGNDTTLQGCACSLHAPLTSEGCPFVDEDGKVAIFPPCIGCLPDTANGQLEMSLKDAMAFVWKARTIKLTVSFSVTSRYIAQANGHTGTIIYTLDGDAIIFSTKDDEAPNPQPLEKMSDIICGCSDTIMAEGTNFINNRFRGRSTLIRDGGSGPRSEGFSYQLDNFSVSPLSIKTVGENTVCDFAYNVVIDPRFEGNSVGAVFVVGTGDIPDGDSAITATVLNGAVIKVNGNTYSTSLNFRGNVPVSDFEFQFTSATANGQVLIEVESERLTE